MKIKYENKMHQKYSYIIMISLLVRVKDLDLDLDSEEGRDIFGYFSMICSIS